jgi:hypothetical protein
MSESICVTLENFTIVQDLTCIQQQRPCKLELKLSFDGEQYFIEEAWLDETINFYDIADKYSFLHKLLEEALKQLKLDRKEAINERGYIENLD